MRQPRFVLAFWTVLLASSAYAADAPNLLRNNQFDKGMEGWFLKGADRCKSEVTVTSREKFQRALRVDVVPQAKDMPWSVVLRQSVGAPLQKGRQLVLKVWLRSPEQVQVTAFVENSAAPYTKSLTATFRLAQDWQEYEIKSDCKEDLPPGQANCGFYLSHGKGTVRIADVRLFQIEKPVEPPKTEPPAVEPPKVDPPKIGAPPAETPKVEPPKVEGPVITPPTPAQIVEPLLDEEDFERNLESWRLPENGNLKAEVATAPPGELPEQWTRVLKLSSEGPADNSTPPRLRSITRPMAAPIAPGDGILVKFWARGPRGGQIGVNAGTTTLPTVLMTARVDLRTEWKEYEVRGVSRGTIETGRSQLALWNGAVDGPLEVAGLRIERVSNAPAGWATPPPVYNLQSLLRSEDFTDGRYDPGSRFLQQTVAGWQMTKKPGVTPEIVEATAGPYKNALRLTFEHPETVKYFSYGLFQPFFTPPLTSEVFVFKFWARSTTTNPLQIMVDQSEKRAPRQPGEPAAPPTSLRRRNAMAGYVIVAGDWHEYTFRPDARVLKQLREQQDLVTQTGTIMIAMSNPQGTLELTGFRLALERPAEP
jgi:hypothetical protein